MIEDEIDQIDTQIEAASIRRDIAIRNLEIHKENIANMEEIKDFNEFKKKSFNYATYKNKKIYEKIYKGMSKSEIHLYIASNYREYKCYEKFIIIPAIVMVAVLYIGFLILVNQ